ncbi:hypothetical protein F511_43861 [Dorcoceras hygrometricum]|uniref:Uncharacterized protein n=1 Tax=Dorcoceras hygrometricum TaxID=472368 RepID=A0A2Z7DDC1_9LAMI|nr:hypothetical protein F511_43861 [Dorcoceras hygrometricum]
MSKAHKGFPTGTSSTQSAPPYTLAIEFSTRDEQEQAKIKNKTQSNEQINEVVKNVVNIEGTAEETGEHQVHSNEHQAHDEQVGETQRSLGEQQEQPGSSKSPTQSGDISVRNEDHVHHLGLDPTSEVNKMVVLLE